MCYNQSDDQSVSPASNPAGTPSRKRQRRPSRLIAAAQSASSALPDQRSNTMFCGSLSAAPAYEQAQGGIASMVHERTQETGHKSSGRPACSSNVFQTDAVAAELEYADCSPPRQQSQQIVLASLPSNQLLDVPAAITALSHIGAFLLIHDTLRVKCICYNRC